MSGPYRVAWEATQEDGSTVTLHSPEYRTLEDAREDLGSLGQVGYIGDAWIEQAEWKRIEP